MTEAAALAIRAAAEVLQPRWIDPPVLQPAGLYLELLGDDLRARAYLVGGDEDGLCLRPDMTTPAVRAALAAFEWETPFAVAYDGVVFRRQSEPGRETEFRQIGVERFGHRDAIGADEAGVVAAALEACGAARPSLRLGDVALFEALVDAHAPGDVWARRFKRAFARPGGLAGALKAAADGAAAADNALAQALAAMPAARAEAVVEELLADARIAVVGGRSIADIAARLREKGAAGAAAPPAPATLAAIAEAVALDAAPAAAFGALSKIARRAAAPAILENALVRAAARWADIASAGVRDAMFSAGFGRGLAFYDGFVFELEANVLGARASLGGGGRYDGLLHRVAASEGGPPDVEDWGALGFALRPQRIAEATP